MRWRISLLVTKGAPSWRVEIKALVVVRYGKVAIRVLPSVPGVTEDLISAVAMQVQIERQGIKLLLVHCILLIANTIASLFYGFWDDCIQPLSDYCTSLWRGQRASSSGYTKVYNHTPSPHSNIDHIPSLHVSVTTFSSSTSFPHPFISFSFFMEGWM